MTLSNKCRSEVRRNLHQNENRISSTQEGKINTTTVLAIMSQNPADVVFQN